MVARRDSLLASSGEKRLICEQLRRRLTAALTRATDLRYMYAYAQPQDDGLGHLISDRRFPGGADAIGPSVSRDFSSARSARGCVLLLPRLGLIKRHFEHQRSL